MGLLQETAYQYYESKQTFIATQGQTDFTVTLDPLPKSAERFNVTLNDVEITSGLTYDANTGIITIAATNLNDVITVILKDPGLGKYRFTSLLDIVNNYMIGYVGDGKIMNSVKRSDVLFHAKRGIQEFAYDVARVEKIQEIEVGPSLSIPMPQDYVNYVKITFVGDDGIERLVLPRRVSSTPKSGLQDHEYNLLFDQDGNITYANQSEAETRFQAGSNDNNSNLDNVIDYLEEGYGYNVDYGKRFGLLPELATKHGTFYINEHEGLISFSGDFEQRIVILKYISDGLATESDMKVHKFAEQAIYSHISYAILSTKQDAPEYRVQRLKKERVAATRKAKLRLSNLKISEFEQVMRGKGKQIKH